MNLIKALDLAQIGTALLIIAFLLFYLAFGKKSKKTSR